ncbi:hypothetical protein CEUSTIGMA_g1105.t1 [Chlamydomonas eustigma]|uniref:Uncharacterized protein n=1 Tax=Chlamydomonas eustigma TaxID=1157962 RepID=A0A250WS31_9CHLO|nr:hypothetical protein CEUSTIGMA_g1105.t1 [Chlamydomonas eustigma]|eukprot:GAX73654.1 hypothetical protein CEUSTIGMA_g1105.t1 [Chlamydomonas eustigma]
MSVNVLRELDELRSMLDTPRKVYAPGSRPESTVQYEAITPSGNSYSYALNSAEKSVDRLGKAIEAAEDEMEAAVRRTNEVHKSQLRQKELELQEQQRLIQGKDRAIESLRETLSATKRTYEGLLSQAEVALSVKEAEAAAAQQDVRRLRDELESTQLRLQQVLQSHTIEVDNLRQQERELQASNRIRSEETVRLATQLRTEREERQSVHHESDTLRRKLELLADELRSLRSASSADKERFESEIEDLNKRLRAERSIRKGCEKWLRAELKSREEYDLLLNAIRETASGRPSRPHIDLDKVRLLADLSASPAAPQARINGASSELQEVEQMLRDLKNSAYASAQLLPAARVSFPEVPNIPSGAGASASPVSALRVEAELARRQLEKDNRELKAELIAARRILQERMGGRVL